MTLDQWLQLGVAIGTLGLAAVTFALVLITKREVGATRDLVTETGNLVQRTAEVVEIESRNQTEAVEARREAVRARIDARSHQVVAYVKTPSWPPTSASAAGEGAVTAWNEGHSFVIPRDENLRLGIWVECALRNVGKGSATVQLPLSARLRQPWEIFGGMEPRGAEPPDLGDNKWALEPQRAMAFDVWLDRPVRDWITAYQNAPDNPEESRVLVEVIVTDQYEEGVIDNLLIEGQMYPLDPVADSLGEWRINNGSRRAAAVRPVKRRYYESKVGSLEL